VIGDLAELIGVSLAATVLLSLAAAACVLGVTRAGELRRAGKGAAATRHAALGAAGGAAVAAGIIGALVVIIAG
jgi:hypothetical protein